MSDNTLPKPIWLPMGDQAIMLDYTGYAPVHQAAHKGADLTAEQRDSIASHIQRLAAHMRRLAPAGLIDIVPALTRLTFVVDPLILSQASLKTLVMLEHDKPLADVALTSRHWVIPVCYDGEFAPDVTEVADRCEMTAEEVISRHLAKSLKVSVMGFMPGSAYLVGVDEALTLPRRANPRTKVPAQSVGIAIGQSVIYPLDSPGGWHLIGRTPFPVFDPHRPEPILFDAGDVVSFRRISETEYDELEQAYAAGLLTEADLRQEVSS